MCGETRHARNPHEPISTHSVTPEGKNGDGGTCSGEDIAFFRPQSKHTNYAD